MTDQERLDRLWDLMSHEAWPLLLESFEGLRNDIAESVATERMTADEFNYRQGQIFIIDQLIDYRESVRAELDENEAADRSLEEDMRVLM